MNHSKKKPDVGQYVAVWQSSKQKKYQHKLIMVHPLQVTMVKNTDSNPLKKNLNALGFCLKQKTLLNYADQAQKTFNEASTLSFNIHRAISHNRPIDKNEVDTIQKMIDE